MIWIALTVVFALIVGLIYTFISWHKIAKDKEILIALNRGLVTAKEIKSLLVVIFILSSLIFPLSLVSLILNKNKMPDVVKKIYINGGIK